MLETALTLTINGDRLSLDNISPTLTLLEYLRQSGRIGTKEGCADGDCGACTIVVVGEGADGGWQYQAMNSCLIPLGAMAGRQLITVEGVAQGGLHPVQAKMVELGGSQCGYCTPGFIMSMFASYYDGQRDDLAVEGNLCRCTGYLPIRRALQSLQPVDAEDPWQARLAQTDADGLPALDYQGQGQRFYRPTQLSQVLALMADHPEATLVAGATDLGLELTHRRQQYPVLISLEAVEELHGIQPAATEVTIGAAVPLSQIKATLHGVFPALDEMLHWFAARQVRNRATLGGNLGTASPIGDLPPVLLALDATVTLASTAGQRTVAIADFFTGYRQTLRQPDEVIVSITIPKTLAPGATRRLSQSYKVGKRGTDDISIVAATFTLDLDEHNTIVLARLAYGGVAATPVRAIAIETALIGQPWTAETVQAVKSPLHNAFTPLSDLRASAGYRRQLVANLFEKFFYESASLRSTS
ncbi:MAG: xanthine dehydrogenase small subunit [Cyanobacteria bacterium]|nr:xanthine dehydrogenase small subunit [Cyanobacteriota bacterium]